jgi:hypothetical protein
LRYGNFDRSNPNPIVHQDFSMRQTICLLLAAVALSVPAISVSAISVRAQDGEKLLAAVPKGYKVSNERNSAGMSVREMLPNGETKSNWTQMVSVLTIPGMGDVSPTKYRERMQQLWDLYCPGSEYVTLKEGVEHGYATLTWLWRCPRSQAGKRELSWMKAIQGRDNLYSVQRAVTFEPSEAQKEELARYIDSVRVCDTRLSDRACP